ncbi:hypothetical protein P9E76_02810 [Schinkia azotoformans]|uniref:Uncharacterized protein n=1 Tax=Schinkia azotoformans LMG 9581 TaxID=1131731 RepID=K6E5P6_SCHAZ|nr:hypothetical protein [Schinkia azotoformans]EKN68576.1 hypothetical protein BAZO_03585 [Schinkia azotoformans LMG 9581]MEC1637603.1 hypothetical protein [Schinkia azotoformans]MEC1944007.1 hypothetical protein [Schinkia azotoformans]
MQKMKLKAKRVTFFVDPKETKPELNRLNRTSSKVLIDRVLEMLYKLQKDCEKQYPIYLPKSTYESLQIALAFSFSKTMNKNTNTVKEVISILDQKEEVLPQNQIAAILNSFVEFIKQGRENYEDVDEVHYLVSNLSPLLYQAKSNES